MNANKLSNAASTATSLKSLQKLKAGHAKIPLQTSTLFYLGCESCCAHAIAIEIVKWINKYDKYDSFYQRAPPIIASVYRAALLLSFPHFYHHGANRSLINHINYCEQKLSFILTMLKYNLVINPKLMFRTKLESERKNRPSYEPWWPPWPKTQSQVSL